MPAQFWCGQVGVVSTEASELANKIRFLRLFLKSFIFIAKGISVHYHHLLFVVRMTCCCFVTCAWIKPLMLLIFFYYCCF